MPNVAVIPNSGAVIAPLTGIVDGWPDEQHSLKTTIGGAPLEDGTRVTDHAIVSSEEVTLTGFVSDWSGGDRPGQAWEAIRALNATLTPVRVVTEWGVYPEMLITEADAPKGGRRGLRFTLKLTWVNRVGIADNELPASELSGPATGRSGIVERGRVALPPVE